MCDNIAGEIIISFHNEDAAAAALVERIAHGEISHVEIIDSLEERLADVGLERRDGTPLKFYRLRVSHGQETFKINYLQFFYKVELFRALSAGRITTAAHGNVLFHSNNHLQIVPNSLLTIRGSSTGIGFAFTDMHNNYKRLLGWAMPDSVKPRQVLVLDTGLDRASQCNPRVVKRANFTVEKDPRTKQPPEEVQDDHGHGTAVAEIIYDLYPSVDLAIYKVADAHGRASEWDTVAALATAGPNDVVNMSLAFGLEAVACPRCGRESHSSRSSVFENFVDQLSGDHGPIIVAAAGNEAATSLAFPARFNNVVAVISINQGRELSGFTNRDTKDQVGEDHNNTFVLPGGDQHGDGQPSEYVGTSANGKTYYGTSFAAAYASGLIAGLWSQVTHEGKSRPAMLEHLRHNADPSLPHYKRLTHGNGLMRFGKAPSDS